MATQSRADVSRSVRRVVVKARPVDAPGSPSVGHDRRIANVQVATEVETGEPIALSRRRESEIRTILGRERCSRTDRRHPRVVRQRSRPDRPRWILGCGTDSKEQRLRRCDTKNRSEKQGRDCPNHLSRLHQHAHIQPLFGPGSEDPIARSRASKAPQLRIGGSETRVVSQTIGIRVPTVLDAAYAAPSCVAEALPSSPTVSREDERPVGSV